MSATLESTSALAVDRAADAGYPTATGTRALSIDASWLRTRTELLHDDVRNLHERTRALDLNDRAHEKATNAGVPELLEELTAFRGMSWSDLAIAVGVSVSAVRKWRSGRAATPENRVSLGRLAAFLDVLEEHMVADPAQWMEMRLPLPAGYYIRPLDLYVAGRAEALIEIAEHRQEAEQVLDQKMPGWRDQRSDFEVIVNPEGERIIRVRAK